MPNRDMGEMVMNQLTRFLRLSTLPNMVISYLYKAENRKKRFIFAMEETDESMVDLFSSSDPTADATLIVEEKKLFVHKSILGKVSPVFARMFYSNGFRESQTSEVHLPGKSYSQILELLRCLYPNVLKPIDQSNAFDLLPLSEEYSIIILKKNIERYFLSSISSGTSTSFKYGSSVTRLFDLLALAQLYRLTRLEEHICDTLTTHFPLEQWNRTDLLSIEVRCHLLELYAGKQQIKLKEKQTKLNELEDLTLKQKFEIQRLKSNASVD